MQCTRLLARLYTQDYLGTMTHLSPLTTARCGTDKHNKQTHTTTRYGFIVMDGNGTLFGTLSGNTREILHKFTVDLPKKHGRGGQSALRFARLRVEKRHNYVRKVAELAVQVGAPSRSLPLSLFQSHAGRRVAGGWAGCDCWPWAGGGSCQAPPTPLPTTRPPASAVLPRPCHPPTHHPPPAHHPPAHPPASVLYYRRPAKRGGPGAGGVCRLQDRALAVGHV